MKFFQKSIFLFLLVVSGFGLFFGDVSLPETSTSQEGIAGIEISTYTLGVSQTYAQGGAQTNPTPPTNTNTQKETPGDNNWEETMNLIISGINFFLGLITSIASVAVGIVGWLLSPDWTSGDLFGLREYLYKLWITVSNIIYFIYAIALIIVAVMTMFNSEKYGYRALLPRLVVGILMVPFTWWAVQWAISVSTVLTASVLSIPMETIGQDEKDTWWTKGQIPKCIASGNPDTEKEVSLCNEKQEYVSPKQFSRDVGGIYGNLVIYAYGVFRMHEVKSIPTTANAIKTAAAIVHKGLVGAVMFLIFGVMLIALTFVLFLRVFKLWAYAIFSPLFTFGFVFKDSTKGLDDEDTFSVREFLGLVFLPAIVGLVLSFGLILINALNNGSESKQSNKEPCNIEQLRKEGGCKIASLMGNPNNSIKREIEKKGDGEEIVVTTFSFGGIDMKWYGGSVSTDGQEAESANTTIGVFSAVGSAFGVIFLDLIAIIFVWIAFMAAKNISKTAKKVITPVENAGKDLVSAAKGFPAHAIKVPGFGSIKGVKKAVDSVGYAMERKVEDSYRASSWYKMMNKDDTITPETRQTLTQNAQRQANEANNIQHYFNTNKTVQNIKPAQNSVQIIKNGNPTWFKDVAKSFVGANANSLKEAFGDDVYRSINNDLNLSELDPKNLNSQQEEILLAYHRGWNGRENGTGYRGAKTFNVTQEARNLAGDRSGDQSGDQTGDQSGDQTGDQSGDQTGGQNGNQNPGGGQNP